MDSLRWIAATSSFVELCQYREIEKVDCEISQGTNAKTIDNTFSITINDAEWASNRVPIGGYIYSPHTEFGGQITLIRHSTSEHTITMEGPTWRGLLFQKVIEPPSGQAYLTFEDVDILSVVRTVIGNKFGSLFTVASGSYGKNVTVNFRYQTIAGGLHKLLRENGLRLKLEFDNIVHTVNVGVESVGDMTDSIELSQDYGIDLTSTQGNTEVTNHCIALGQGNLENRTRIDVYRVGTEYFTNKPASLSVEQLRTIVYDYPNAESNEELLNGAIDRLQETAPANEIKLDEVDLGESVSLGDLIGIRDRLTGMHGTAEVVGKICSVSDGKESISMTVNAVGTTYKDSRTWDEVKTMTWAAVKIQTWSYFGG